MYSNTKMLGREGAQCLIKKDLILHSIWVRRSNRILCCTILVQLVFLIQFSQLYVDRDLCTDSLIHFLFQPPFNWKQHFPLSTLGSPSFSLFIISISLPVFTSSAFTKMYCWKLSIQASQMTCKFLPSHYKTAFVFFSAPCSSLTSGSTMWSWAIRLRRLQNSDVWLQRPAEDTFHAWRATVEPVLDPPLCCSGWCD